MKGKRVQTSLLVATLACFSTAVGSTSPSASAQSTGVVRAVSVAVSPQTGHVFAVSGNDATGKSILSTIDGKSGQILGTAALPAWSGWRLLVDDRTHHVFVSAYDPSKDRGKLFLTLADTQTGRVLTTVGLGQAGPLLDAAVASRSGRVVLITKDRLILINPANGVRISQKPMNGLDSVELVHDGTGRVFIVDHAGKIQVYDLRALNLSNTVQLSGVAFTMGLSPIPVLTTGDVYLMTGDKGERLNMLDATTGKVRWSMRIPNAPGGIVSVAVDRPAGHLVAVSLGSLLYAGVKAPAKRAVVTTVDLKSHTIVWTVKLPGTDAIHMSFDPATHHVFALLHKGFNAKGQLDSSGSLVSVVDSETGRLVRTTAVPYAEYSIALVVANSQHSRVYVTLNMSSTAAANTLTVLDARTGALLSGLPLPS